MDAVELIRYNHAARRTYLEALSKLSWNEVEKSRGASFDSMKNIFLHLTFVELRMIHYVIPGKANEYVERSFDEFRDIGSLRRLSEDVEKKTEAYLKKLTPEELRREVGLPWRKTPPTKISVENILAQVAVEDIYHYGELIALIWQADAEAPYLSWMQYTSGQ
jgi:uncharacterized damage-inducible protein DinB